MLHIRHFLIPWLIFEGIRGQNVVQSPAPFEHPDPLQNLFQHHHQFQQQQLALGLPQHPPLPPHPMLQHPLNAGPIPTLPPHHFMSHPFFFNHPAFLQPHLVPSTPPPSIMGAVVDAQVTDRPKYPPQAVKPAIQSDVKAFTEKNRPIDRSVEKLRTVSAEVRSPLAYSPTKELRKVEIVPVEHILLSTTMATTTATEITSTTTESTTEATTTTTEGSTTNLPQKIEEERQFAEKHGETLDLIKHLNSSDLENFLQSANLTTKEAQRFLKLVLEEELSKRLHNRTSDGATIDNHEVKTVDTHLKFDEVELSTISPSPTPSFQPSTTTGTPVIVAALSQKSGPSEKLTGSTVAIHSLDDVRKREQEEFDRLLGQIVLETKDENDENEDDDLLVNSNGQKPAVPARNNFRLTTRHPPKTQFEHLVEDYRYRLSSSNGFNDLIKALRNAHIGFFDRSPVKRKPIG